jgi:hypothetical protein
LLTHAISIKPSTVKFNHAADSNWLARSTIAHQESVQVEWIAAGPSDSVPIASARADSERVPIATGPSDSEPTPIASARADSEQEPIPTGPSDSDQTRVASTPAGSEQAPIATGPSDSDSVPIASARTDSEQVPIGFYLLPVSMRRQCRGSVASSLVLQDIGQVAHVDPATARGALHEMLPLVLGAALAGDLINRGWYGRF